GGRSSLAAADCACGIGLLPSTPAIALTRPSTTHNQGWTFAPAVTTEACQPMRPATTTANAEQDFAAASVSCHGEMPRNEIPDAIAMTNEMVAGETWTGDPDVSTAPAALARRARTERTILRMRIGIPFVGSAEVGQAAQHAAGAGRPRRQFVVEILRQFAQRRTRLRIESTRSHQAFNLVDETESPSHGPLESGDSIGCGAWTTDRDDRRVLSGAI